MLITWLDLGEIMLETFFFSKFVLAAIKQLYEWSFTSVRLAARPSVHLWTEWCQLHIFHNTISYLHFTLHFLSTNFRRCVTCFFWVFLIPKCKFLAIFFKFVTLSCVHVIWMLKLIPDLRFYCSCFKFTMTIPLDGLVNMNSEFGQNFNFLFLTIFLIMLFKKCLW